MNCDLFVWCGNKGVDRYEAIDRQLTIYNFWFLCDDCAARLYHNGVIGVD